jgi:hypothetical protein
MKFLRLVFRIKIKKGKHLEREKNISKDGAPQKEYPRDIHKWKLLGAVLHQKH